MSVAVFNFALAMLLLSVFASALSSAAFLVSRKNTLGYAAVGFLFYFLDVAWVFQDTFVGASSATLHVSSYEAIRTILTLCTGTGTFGSFWIVACEYVNEQRRNMRIAPIVVFAILSIASLLALPAGDIQRFVFYSWRMVFVAFILCFIALKCLRAKDEMSSLRFKRHRLMYLLAWVFCIAVVVEDILCFFVLDANVLAKLAIIGIPERNFAENILALVIIFTNFIASFHVLSIRFDERPMAKDGGTTDIQETAIKDTLPHFGKRFGLTERERHVLHLILQGKTNQEIATMECLSPSTVKVHVHNILKKTESENRQELIKAFWRF